MSNVRYELIAELKDVLASQRYSPVVVGNYCAYGREFLLTRRTLDVATVTPTQVEQYLRHAIRRFHKRHDRRPGPYSSRAVLALDPARRHPRVAAARTGPMASRCESDLRR